eukprot:467550-Rhodomonas_salina.3
MAGTDQDGHVPRRAAAGPAHSEACTGISISPVVPGTRLRPRYGASGTGSGYGPTARVVLTERMVLPGLLATASLDKTVKLWDIRNNEANSATAYATCLRAC